jgi:hypothetical protein
MSIVAKVRAQFTTFLVSLLICSALFLAVWFWCLRQPTLTISTIREVDGIAVRGGSIHLLATIHRHRQCESTSERWLWRWIDVDGKRIQQWVLLEGNSAPPTPIGVDTYVVTLALPPSVTAGDWFYVGIARDSCGWLPAIFSAPLRETPAVPVRVNNPSVDRPATVVLPNAPFEALSESK